MNECGSRNSNQCQQLCANTIGGYYCACRAGWELVPSNVDCEQDTIKCELIQNDYTLCTCRERFSNRYVPMNGTRCRGKEHLNVQSSNIPNNTGYFADIFSNKRSIFCKAMKSGIWKYCRKSNFVRSDRLEKSVSVLKYVLPWPFQSVKGEIHCIPK